MVLKFTGERIVPGADNCEPTFAQKMYQEHVARYAFAAQFTKGKEVLDVGCGVGYGTQWLAREGAKSVLGIDLAEDAIDHARKNYFHPAVAYRALNAAELDVEDSMDVVVCFELIEHVRDQVRVLDGIKSALRQDGVLVISTPRPLEEIRTHFHEHELDFEELRDLLKKRFRYVDVFFERNYFTSFIGSSEPNSIDQIVSITDRYSIEHADYFIFVASNEKLDRFGSARNVLSVNDDSYVLKLENDMAAMRNGESYHLGLIKELEARVESESGARMSADARAQQAEQHAAWIEKVYAETGALRQELGTLQAAVSTIAEKSHFAGLQVDLSQIREEFARLRGDVVGNNSGNGVEALQHDLAGVRDEVIRLRAELADQIARAHEIETGRARIRTLENELAGMAPRQELAAALDKLTEAETTLFSMRNKRDMLLAEVEQLRLMKGDCEHLRNVVAEQSARLFELEAQARTLSDQNDGLRRELEHVRQVHGENSRRLAETETETFFLRQENSELRESAARANDLASELGAVRSRLDYAEATLARFRGSVSWAVTRPVRWTGRTYKKLVGQDA